MKVLLIDVYNFNKGGAETVCFNTGKLLEDHGHSVVYFTLKWDRNNPSPFSSFFPESKETRKGPLRQIRNLVNYFYHFEAAKKIEDLIREEKPDIAHIHLLWGQITPSILPVLKKYKIPVLYTVHDYRIVCPAYTFRNGKGFVCEECKGRFFYKCFVNSCCKGNKVMSFVMAMEQYFRNMFFSPVKYINGFIYVSVFAKSIQERYMDEIKYLPNIILYNFSTSITNLPKQIPDEKYYLYFGRLSYEKGLKTVLSVIKRMPQCKLKIVGTGPKEKELKEFVEDSKIENVEFLGYKSGNELKNLVRNAFFVLVPSEWYENNPMSIVESYSVGTPVIGANIGGIPEIVLEGETGFQFISGNSESLEYKLNVSNHLSSDEYLRLSEGSLKFAREKLSIENYYQKLIGFYNRFL